MWRRGTLRFGGTTRVRRGRVCRWGVARRGRRGFRARLVRLDRRGLRVQRGRLARLEQLGRRGFKVLLVLRGQPARRGQPGLLARRI